MGTPPSSELPLSHPRTPPPHPLFHVSQALQSPAQVPSLQSCDTPHDQYDCPLSPTPRFYPAPVALACIGAPNMADADLDALKTKPRLSAAPTGKSVYTRQTTASTATLATAPPKQLASAPAPTDPAPDPRQLATASPAATFSFDAEPTLADLPAHTDTPLPVSAHLARPLAAPVPTRLLAATMVPPTDIPSAERLVSLCKTDLSLATRAHATAAEAEESVLHDDPSVPGLRYVRENAGRREDRARAALTDAFAYLAELRTAAAAAKPRGSPTPRNDPFDKNTDVPPIAHTGLLTALGPFHMDPSKMRDMFAYFEKFTSILHAQFSSQARRDFLYPQYLLQLSHQQPDSSVQHAIMELLNAHVTWDDMQTALLKHWRFRGGDARMLDIFEENHWVNPDTSFSAWAQQWLRDFRNAFPGMTPDEHVLFQRMLLRSLPTALGRHVQEWMMRYRAEETHKQIQGAVTREMSSPTSSTLLLSPHTPMASGLGSLSHAPITTPSLHMLSPLKLLRNPTITETNVSASQVIAYIQSLADTNPDFPRMYGPRPDHRVAFRERDTYAPSSQRPSSRSPSASVTTPSLPATASTTPKYSAAEQQRHKEKMDRMKERAQADPSHPDARCQLEGHARSMHTNAECREQQLRKGPTRAATSPGTSASTPAASTLAPTSVTPRPTPSLATPANGTRSSPAYRSASPSASNRYTATALVTNGPFTHTLESHLHPEPWYVVPMDTDASPDIVLASATTVQPMAIFVRTLAGASYPLDVYPSTSASAVLDMLAARASLSDVEHASLRLVYGSHDLSDKITMEAAGVTHGSTLHTLARLRAGNPQFEAPVTIHCMVDPVASQLGDIIETMALCDTSSTGVSYVSPSVAAALGVATRAIRTHVDHGDASDLRRLERALVLGDLHGNFRQVLYAADIPLEAGYECVLTADTLQHFQCAPTVMQPAHPVIPEDDTRTGPHYHRVVEILPPLPPSAALAVDGLLTVPRESRRDRAPSRRRTTTTSPPPLCDDSPDPPTVRVPLRLKLGPGPNAPEMLRFPEVPRAVPSTGHANTPATSPAPAKRSKPVAPTIQLAAVVLELTSRHHSEWDTRKHDSAIRHALNLWDKDDSTRMRKADMDSHNEHCMDALFVLAHTQFLSVDPALQRSSVFWRVRSGMTRFFAQADQPGPVQERYKLKHADPTYKPPTYAEFNALTDQPAGRPAPRIHDVTDAFLAKAAARTGHRTAGTADDMAVATLDAASSDAAVPAFLPHGAPADTLVSPRAINMATLGAARRQ